MNAVVDIDVKQPQENVFLKDALNEAVYTLFGSNITNQNSNTTITLSIVSSSLDPLDYDKNGYPILYRSSVTLQANIIDKKNKKRTYSVNGTYDFATSPNSVINDQIKLNAFKKASINALNKLIALITKDAINEH
ncbi:LPS assembly lipoprotein LptE [Lebetimonas sp. JS138]|uniref:LPS assembly lipoprotein LptE n=1 Tax=Lebetimonas sp. JS138 TaxID=990072 RepID=UPI002E811C1C|nr:LPS assembly lipoprotein LptE [Lebetimonas sp. JS138]